MLELSLLSGLWMMANLKNAKPNTEKSYMYQKSFVLISTFLILDVSSVTENVNADENDVTNIFIHSKCSTIYTKRSPKLSDNHL